MTACLCKGFFVLANCPIHGRKQQTVRVGAPTLDEFFEHNGALRFLRENLNANMENYGDRMEEEEREGLMRVNLIMFRQCLEQLSGRESKVLDPTWDFIKALFSLIKTQAAQIAGMRKALQKYADELCAADRPSDIVALKALQTPAFEWEKRASAQIEIAKIKSVDRRVGSWLSAALEDPNVCKEMKEGVKRWFDVQDKLPPMLLLADLTTPLTAFGGMTALEFCYEHGPEGVLATFQRMYDWPVQT